MPGLPTFNLTEPLVEAMVALLEANLNTNITALNAAYADAYPVPAVAQFLPFVPIPSTLEGGMPAVGVQEVGSTFMNDIVTTVDAQHTYAVVAICSHVDQQTLATQLRRMMQAILYTVQQDRMLENDLGGGGVMRGAGAWSVNLMSYEPGPLLGDLDPTDPEAPPQVVFELGGLRDAEHARRGSPWERLTDSRRVMPLARWIGPFDALLPNNSRLRVGETLEVSDRDLESAHWELVSETPAPAPAASKPSAFTSLDNEGDD